MFNIFKRKSNTISAADRNSLHADALRINNEIDHRMQGQISTPENSMARLYRGMQVDTALRSTILDLRHMDKVDTRVKKVHRKISRDVTKGGLRLSWTGSENKRVNQTWKKFVRRLQLNRREKLKSDARGVAMEGSLCMQWVVGPDNHIVAGLRMPSETIVPNVDERGVITDPANAFKQIDIFTQREQASFALWQMSIARLDPDNFDDPACMGRPYLDAARSVWRKLIMTEEDLVIRRRARAPQKLAHVLDGASETELEAYEQKIKGRSGEIETDFFMNKKGSVTAITGDTNLDQIADVSHLLDTFFTGSPAPKGLFGYVGDLARDVLEDLKRDYYEEIDGLQDVCSNVYEQGFRLELLLNGMNPDAYDFTVQYAERMTETRNQRADYALKLQAMNVPTEMVWSEAGLDPTQVKAKYKDQQNSNDPYPDFNKDDVDPEGPTPKVSITPGNSPKGESGTSISSGS